MRRATSLAFCASLAVSACASAATPWAEVGGTRFKVEVAQDDATRARGLMFRDELASDSGMLFIHDREEPLAYWMKNTRIPLDILYFDSRRTLVSMSLDTPPCTTPYCPSYPSERPARYVLELNAGQARALGVAPGATLTIEPGATRPKLD
jgi:uncharacterized protein